MFEAGISDNVGQIDNFAATIIRPNALNVPSDRVAGLEGYLTLDDFTIGAYTQTALIEQDLNAITFESLTNQNPQAVKNYLVLPVTGMYSGEQISWSTNIESLLVPTDINNSTFALWNKSVLADESTNIILTATIGSQSKNFDITILKDTIHEYIIDKPILTQENSILQSVNITATANASASIMLIAIYNQSGSLLDVIITPVESLQLGNAISYTINQSLSDYIGAATIKTMIFNNTSDLKPLAIANTVNINQ